MILLYIITCIICVYVLFLMYMKIKYPFWSKQPVFHFHKLHYFLKNDNYIFNNPSQMNAYKYLDYPNIKIIPFKHDDCYKTNKYLIESYFSLIRKHYLREKHSIFNPTNEYLKNCLINNENGSSFIALYLKSRPVYHNVENTNNTPTSLTLKNDVISGLTSKIIVLHRRSLPKHLQNRYIHYVDFLCTHTDNRKKQLTPKVIYTYAHHVMKQQSTRQNSSSDSIIFMFKREAENQSFVPYTVYSNFVFELKYFISKYKSLSSNQNAYFITLQNELKLDYINTSSTELLFRTLEEVKTSIPHFLHIPFSNVKTYIEAGVLHMFVVHKNGVPCALYVFKNNCFYYQDLPVYECVSSIYFPSSLYNIELFVNFFNKSVETLIHKQKIGYLTIENLSMNNILIKNMRNMRHELYKYTNNFYLYNYILNSTQSKEIFMII
jgi:hypothetical protein